MCFTFEIRHRLWPNTPVCRGIGRSQKACLMIPPDEWHVFQLLGNVRERAVAFVKSSREDREGDVGACHARRVGRAGSPRPS